MKLMIFNYIFVHSTTRNTPYVHPGLYSIFELCRTFPIIIKFVKVGYLPHVSNRMSIYKTSTKALHNL